MENTIIVTITDITNYGNRLQNYALNQLLTSYGACSTAEFVPGINGWQTYTKMRIKESLHLRSAKLLMFRLLRPKSEQCLNLTRRYRMRHFTDAFIPHGQYRLSSYKGLETLRRGNYDTIVLGSDQIWNPTWPSLDELKLYLGSFAKNGSTIVSYAASFGISSIEDSEIRKVFAEYLPRIDSISVRERRGEQLVEDLGHVSAKVVLDPTLMLSAKQWQQITNSFVPKDDRYVLTYFLGKPSEEQQRCIMEYATMHNCRVRRILDPSDPETYVAGPEDFVELFSKAQYVFTDSYHACCFSILFHKQFTVFTRSGLSKGENMNSRMETLFDLFQLDSVVMDDGIAPNIDYVRVDELLDWRRAESKAWLDNAMGK